MHKIESRILYDDIVNNSPQGGLYVWATPDENSTLKLQRMMYEAPFKTHHATEYHCTLLFHKGSLPFEVTIPEDRKMKAQVQSLQVWEDHKQEFILVGLLSSPQIKALHYELIAEGFEHTFPDYTPHITLGKRLKLGMETRLWVQDRNDELLKHPLKLEFFEHINASSLE